MTCIHVFLYLHIFQRKGRLSLSNLSCSLHHCGMFFLGLQNPFSHSPFETVFLLCFFHPLFILVFLVFFELLFVARFGFVNLSPYRVVFVMQDKGKEQWKGVPLSKEEEEGITVKEDVEIGGEIFSRTLVGKLWTNNPFNVRAFKSTMIQGR